MILYTEEGETEKIGGRVQGRQKIEKMQPSERKPPLSGVDYFLSTLADANLRTDGA